MKKDNKRKIIIYISIGIVLLSLLHAKRKKSDPENYYVGEVSTDVCYSYKEGNVYICNSLIEGMELRYSCNESDVIVVDQSDYADPNMKILSSYKITDVENMKEILEIIKKYCASKETMWDRSIESMQNEWIVHNMCSFLSIKNSSTDDVDLNNDDEMFYSYVIVNKILRK